MKTLSWRNVLDCKTWVGDINRMYELANTLGYCFFLWNGRVYQIPQKIGGKPEVVDTGLTEKDIE